MQSNLSTRVSHGELQK